MLLTQGSVGLQSSIQDIRMAEPTTALEEFSEQDPWDRLADEPWLWFDRFTKYRLMGPNRNLRKVYREDRAHRTPDNPLPDDQGAPHDWTAKSKIYHWKERAEAWDLMIYEEQEEAARVEMSSGYSLAHMRVHALKALAVKLDDYLLDPKNNRLSPYVLEQYRGLLDDIAKEMGHRVKETRFTGANGGPIVIETQWGRGGSATNAWEKTTVTEVADSSDEGEDK